MNIFYLHKNPERCAQMHIDKHVVKIPLEVAQMACTNAVILKFVHPVDYTGKPLDREGLDDLKEYRKVVKEIPQDEREVPYLPCHPNHPCTIWMRTSSENFLWAFDYAMGLEKEYTHRYGKPSLKACDVLRQIFSEIVTYLPRKGFTIPALAMPDQYKCDDPVMSYRNYYLGEKAGIATWKGRSAPDWWKHV